MRSRSQRSSQERAARSSAVRHVADSPLLRGSLVVMHRKCGKPGCHCEDGEKHASLYLAVRVGKKRTMIYIPQRLEKSVRQWVENGQQINELLDFVSQQCLEQLLEQKRQGGGQLPQPSAHRKRQRKDRTS